MTSQLVIMMHANEEAKFLARKSLAQSKRVMMVAGKANKTRRRDIENENSARTIVPHLNVHLRALRRRTCQ